MVDFDQLSFLALGTATHGLDPAEPESFRLLDAYRERGGNVIDTARCYSDWVPGESGRSENLLGRWLKARKCRDALCIATKGGHPPMDDFARPRLGRKDLLHDLDQSRRALGVECIDLYWLHRDDPARPVEELLETLEQFRARGWIRRYGASNFSVARLKEADSIAAANGWAGFSANQPMACLGARYRQPMEIPLLVVLDAEGERFHRAGGLPLFPYTSQAAGYYEKAVRLGPDHPLLASHPFHTAGCNRLAEQLGRIAAASGCSVSALVLAWWRTKPYPVHPLVGCRTVAQLEDCFKALEAGPGVLAALAALDAG